MKCICCHKNVRTTRDERDAFHACGYYTPHWWIRDQAVNPDKVSKRGIDPENNEDFLCFDCAHEINCEPSDSGKSILTPVSESKKLKKENKIKESNMPRGNGGWPYDEDDIVWDDNDEILVSLRMNAYPANVQDAVMSPATAFDADGYPALSPEIEAEMLSFDTDVDDKIKSYGGYEFVYDGDGESGMTAPQETGMWCMTYGEFQEMLQQEGLPESWFDIQLKSSWY